MHDDAGPTVFKQANECVRASKRIRMLVAAPVELSAHHLAALPVSRQICHCAIVPEMPQRAPGHRHAYRAASRLIENGLRPPWPNAHYRRRGRPWRFSGGSQTPRREGSPTVKKSGRPSAVRSTATSRMVLSRGGSSAPTTSPSRARASASSLAVTPAPHDNHWCCTVPPSRFPVPGAGGRCPSRSNSNQNRISDTPTGCRNRYLARRAGLSQ